MKTNILKTDVVLINKEDCNEYEYFLEGVFFDFKDCDIDTSSLNKENLISSIKNKISKRVLLGMFITNLDMFTNLDYITIHEPCVWLSNVSSLVEDFSYDPINDVISAKLRVLNTECGHKLKKYILKKNTIFSNLRYKFIDSADGLIMEIISFDAIS